MWQLQRFTKMCQDLVSRGRSHPDPLPLVNFRFEGSRLLLAVSNQPDSTTTAQARPRKFLTHPCRASSFAQAIRDVSCWQSCWRGFLYVVPIELQQPLPAAAKTPACSPAVASRCLPIFPQASTVPACRRGWFAANTVVPMPPKWWDQRFQPIDKLKRRQLDDTTGPGLRRLSRTSRPDQFLRLSRGRV